MEYEIRRTRPTCVLGRASLIPGSMGSRRSCSSERRGHGSAPPGCPHAADRRDQGLTCRVRHRHALSVAPGSARNVIVAGSRRTARRAPRRPSLDCPSRAPPGDRAVASRLIDAVGSRRCAIRLRLVGNSVASRERPEYQPVRLPGAGQVPAVANGHEPKSEADASADRGHGPGMRGHGPGGPGFGPGERGPERR